MARRGVRLPQTAPTCRRRRARVTCSKPIAYSMRAASTRTPAGRCSRRVTGGVIYRRNWLPSCALSIRTYAVRI